MTIRFLSLILGFALAIAPALALKPVQPIRLWDQQGTFLRDYNYKVAHLKPGDTIELGRGKTITITGLVGEGHGNTTWIYGISDGRAIRLPLMDGLFENTEYRAFILWYYRGYEKLKDLGLPIVKVYTGESDPEHYLIVDKMKIRFGLDELIAHSPDDPKYAQAYRDLEVFARKSWPIRKIGDMHIGQVVYTDHGWVLMDYNDVVKTATSVDDATLFSYMIKLPQSWRSRINAWVKGERAAHHLGANSSTIHCVLDRLRDIVTRVVR